MSAGWFRAWCILKDSCPHCRYWTKDGPDGALPADTLTTPLMIILDYEIIVQ